MLFGLDNCQFSGTTPEQEKMIKESLEKAILNGQIDFSKAQVMDANILNASEGGEIIDVNPEDIHSVEETPIEVEDAIEESAPIVCTEDSYGNTHNTPVDMLAENNVISDIVKESADKIRYGKYRIEDLDEYIKKIDALSFLEAVSLQKQCKKALGDLETAKGIFDAVDQIKLDDTINSSIMKANVLKQHGIEEDAEDFRANFEDNKTKLEAVLKKTTEIIDARKDDMNSTSALTKEMVDVLKKKVSSLGTTLNAAYFETRLKNTLVAFENRTDLGYLTNRATCFAQNKNSVKEFIKLYTKCEKADKADMLVMECTKDLQKDFTKGQIGTFFNILMELFDEHQEFGVLFMYFLNKVCASEQRTAKNTWVRVLILNLLDDKNGIYDLGDIEEYKEGIKTILAKLQPVVSSISLLH